MKRGMSRAKWFVDHKGQRWRVPRTAERLRLHMFKNHAALRDFVLHRDGYACRRCRARYAPFTIDHVVSIRNGGNHHPSNLQTLCKACNDHKARYEDRGLAARKDTAHGSRASKTNAGDVVPRAVGQDAGDDSLHV